MKCPRCGGELERYECSRTETSSDVPHRPSQCLANLTAQCDRLAARLAEAEARCERRLRQYMYATCDACGGQFEATIKRCPSCGDRHKLSYGYYDVHALRAELETTKARLAEAEVRIDDQTVIELTMAKFIVSSFARDDHRMPPMDHACSRCIPGGPIVISGFVCARHIAEGLLAAISATGGKETR